MLNGGGRASPNRISVCDPIDVVTGECFLHRTDFTLPGPIPLEWRTYYSNRLNLAGPIGWRWTFPYHSSLVLAKAGIVFQDGLGGEVVFPMVAEVGATAPASAPGFHLTRESETELGVLLSDGTRRRFRITSMGGARLEAITDRNGHAIRLAYNASGHLTEILDSASRALNLQLDPLGRIVSVKCARASGEGSRTLVSYEYDGAGDLVAVEDATGAVYRYEYDDAHQMLRRINRNGYAIEYRYAASRCVQTWGEDGLFAATFEYDPVGRRTLVTGSDGRRNEYRYDKRGLVLEEVDPFGRVTAHTYDDDGHRVVRVDRCDRAWTAAFNEQGRIAEEATPTGQKTSYTYDEAGHLLEKSDAAGATRYEYDDRGNLVRETTPDGGVTVHRYDDAGRRVFSRSPGALGQTFEYDAFHQLVRVGTPTGDTQLRYEYDLVGNVIAETDASGRVQYAYDAMARMVEVRYADGTSEESRYDAEGNATSFRDRAGRAWQYRYRSRKLLAEVEHPDGGVVRYDQTPTEELSTVIDANGNRTDYRYDQCDHLVEIYRDGALYERYERDGEGRPTAKYGADGTLLISLQYDEGERPTGRTISRDGRSVESVLRYDAQGRMVAAEDDWAKVTRAYHPLGPIEEEVCNGRGVKHEFDTAGRLLRTDFGNGVQFRQVFDGDTIVLRDPTGGWHARRVLDSAIAEWRWANGVQETFEHDDEGRVMSHVLRRPSGGATAGGSYEYDVTERLARRRGPGGDEAYERDACQRLTAVRATGSNRGERFSYDLAGNRLPPNRQDGSVAKGNRLTRWEDRSFEYDDRGRLVVEEAGGKPRRFRYDSGDQLVAIERGSEVMATYTYDALRRRVAKDVPEGRTEFGWEGTRLAWEQDPEGRRRCYFYAEPGSHTPVMFCDELPASGDGSRLEVFFVHSDPLGRPFLVTDTAGRTAWSAEWSAYGDATVRSERGLTFNLRSPGHYFDEESGLLYNYHRYYDSGTGRYIQPDPIGLAGGLNLYGYLEGDPLHGCEILGLAGA